MATEQTPNQQNPPKREPEEELDNIGFIKKLFKLPWEFLNGDDNAEENKEEKDSSQVIETTGEAVK